MVFGYPPEIVVLPNTYCQLEFLGSWPAKKAIDSSPYVPSSADEPEALAAYGWLIASVTVSVVPGGALYCAVATTVPSRYRLLVRVQLLRGPKVPMRRRCP